MTMKRKSWQDYQKEIADDHYYYARSCIRQNFFPGSEKLFIDMLRNDLGKDLSDDPKHSSCTGIGYHSDIVPLETIMTVVARQFALMGASSRSPRAWPTRRMSCSISAKRSPRGPKNGSSTPRRANR